MSYPEPEVFDASAATPVGSGRPPSGGPSEVRRLGEVEDRRSERSTTYELSDGTFETVISSGPVHVEQPDGSFEPVDTRLEPRGGGWSPARTSFRAHLPERAGGPVSFETAGQRIAFTLDTEELEPDGAEPTAPDVASGPDAAGPADEEASEEAGVDGEDEPAVGVAEGSEVTYDEVADGVTVALSVTPEAVKEEVVLADADAPRRFVWDLEVSDGLTPVLNDAREVAFLDGDGQRVADVPAPFLYDATADLDTMAADLDSFTSELDVSLENTADGGWRYIVDVDGAWLDAPDRAWPVTLDPTIRETPFRDCMIASGSSADSNYCSSTAMALGKNDDGRLRRALLYFDTAYTFREFLQLPANIVTAELSVRVTSSVRFPTALYGMLDTWDSGATWNQRRASGAAWSTPGGGAVTTVPGSTGGEVGGWNGSTYWGADPNRQYWYPTDLVQRWVDGDLKDRGIRIQALDEAENRLMMFGSADHPTLSYRPELRIQWSRGIGEREGYSWSEETEVTDRSQYAVNTGTGNLYLTANDLTIPGVAGHDLSVDRAYNSLRHIDGDFNDTVSEYAGDFGVGWTSSIDSRERLKHYSRPGIRIVYTHPSGWTQSFYDRLATGVYRSPRRTNLEIQKLSTGHYEVEDRSTGVIERFAANGRLLSIRDDDGNTIAYDYTDNLVSAVRDSRGGGIPVIERNSTGQITRMVDHAGREYRYTYSSRRLRTYTDPSGAVTDYGYSSSWQLYRITSPEGATHTFTYRSRIQQLGGTVTSVKRPRGGTTTYDFAYQMDADAPSRANHQVNVKNARGHTMRHWADARGRVLKSIDARGIARESAYDSFDNVTSFTDRPGGTPTVNSYTSDGLGLASVKTPTGSTYRFGHGGSDSFRPTSYTNPQGQTTNYAWSGHDLTSITDPTAAKYEMVYDSKGLVTKTVDPRKPSGSTSTAYDTVYRYDSLGRVTSVTPPAGARPVTIGAYDTLHRPVRVTDGNGHTTRYAYDALDRPTEVIYHDGTRVVFVYDDNGRRTSRTDPNGTRTTAYDVDGNVVRERGPGGDLDYTYDLVGNLTSMTEGGETVSYAYNASNLVTRVTEPGSGIYTALTYASDADVVTAMSFPTGSTRTVQSFTYDKSNRVTAIEAKRGSTVLTRASYDYRKADGTDGSLRTSRKLTNGTPEVTTTYGYDGADRLLSAVSSAGSDFRYGYDKAGNRIRETVGADTVANSTYYGYDNASELCWSISGTSPGRSTCSTPSGATGYSHDGAGNLRMSTDGMDLRYDTGRRTTSMKTAGQTSALAATYAGAGQAERLTAGPDEFVVSIVGLTGATRSVPATGGQLQTTRTSWVRTPSGDLIGQRATGLTGPVTGTERAYYLTDGLGSVLAVVDDTGTVRNRYDYTPYGDTSERCPTGSCVDNPWRFAGEYQDAQTGLYKIGERYYAPELGRWTQADPLANRINPANPGEANPYAYAASNPINNTDPSGMASATATLVSLTIAALLLGQNPTFEDVVQGVLAELGGAVVSAACLAVFTAAALGCFAAGQAASLLISRYAF